MQSEGNILSCADDTLVFNTTDTWQGQKVKSQEDFNRIIESFESNELTLNADKIRYLPFTSWTSKLPDMGPLMLDNGVSIPENFLSSIWV